MKRIQLFISVVCASAFIMFNSFTPAGEKDNTGKKETAETKVVKTCVVKGRVVDQKTSEPLAGVALKVNGSDKCIYTDLDGNYSLTGITPGKCEVKVDLISYESKTVVLNPDGNLDIDLNLKRK